MKTTEADIILLAIHFPQIFNYNLEWHHEHAKRRKEGIQQWTTQEVANEKVDKQAGRAWKEEYDGIQPETVAPHYHQYMSLQTILPDGSILGNLARKILETIMTFRGKQQLWRTLKMMEERCGMIDEEITASNARKIWMSSSARAHFLK